jgi:hypothetical protein
MSAWDANDPTFGRPLAAPLEQCSASTWPPCAPWPPTWSRICGSTAPRSGASCSWNAGCDPKPMGGSGAATSAADVVGPRVPNPQLQERLAVAEPRAARVIPALAGPQQPPAQPVAQQRPRRPIHRRRHPAQQRHLLA